MNTDDLSLQELLAEYEANHSHPFNLACHVVGIPLVVLSVPLLLIAPFKKSLWRWALGLFGLGWGLQFLGHAVEGKPPTFITQPHSLLASVRWWLALVNSWLRRDYESFTIEPPLREIVLE